MGCGKEFEKIVPRHDSQVDCPHCASLHVDKQLSVFAVSSSQAPVRGLGGAVAAAEPLSRVCAGCNNANEDLYEALKKRSPEKSLR
jgi:putative FmdB family regulatory protein